MVILTQDLAYRPEIIAFIFAPDDMNIGSIRKDLLGFVAVDDEDKVGFTVKRMIHEKLQVARIWP